MGLFRCSHNGEEGENSPILHELKRHTPFTIFGALTGVAIGAFFYNLPYSIAYKVFYTLHPIHIVLSALVTASMYKNYKCPGNSSKCSPLSIIAVGFAGAIGITTLSDSVIPYLGETLLNMPNRGLHIGFIEEWQVVLPLAAVGVAIAYFKPATKAPHAGHVLISTWASLFHVIMAAGSPMSGMTVFLVFLFLFIAVWVPCCISDIVFPLLFVGKKKAAACEKA